jgi:hypothetical protein
MPWGAAAAAAATIGGAYMSSQASKSAANTSADAQRYAADRAAEAARFTPVGITTNLGSSNFSFNPDGTINSAGYTLDPRLQGIQNRLFGSIGAAPQRTTTQTPQLPAGYSLTDTAPMQPRTSVMPSEGTTWAYGPSGDRIEVPLVSTTTESASGGYSPEEFMQRVTPLYGGAESAFNLGQQYLATSPQQAAADYMSQQQGLLAPGREQQLAGLRNQQYQTGRTGLATGGTVAGGMQQTNPELAAYYNSIAQQNSTLAAQSDAYGQQRTQFGLGLFGTGGGLLSQVPSLTTQGYGPLQTQLGLLGSIEGMGQQPFDLSTALGAKQATAGANVGKSLLEGGTSAAKTAQQGNQYSFGGAALQGLGSNQALNSWFQNQINKPNYDSYQTSGDMTYFGSNSSGMGAGEGYSGMNADIGLY